MSLLDRIRRHLPSLLVFALALGAAGCFDHYQVISSSGPPSELVGVTSMTVQYDYSNVRISNKGLSEEEWLASREEDAHRETYLETKESANIGIIEGLQAGLSGVQFATGQAPAGTIQVTVSYTDWEEGMYAGPVAWPSKIGAHVIFSRDGVTLDEIAVNAKEDASVFTPAPQQRLHTCGQRLGEFAAEYVRKAAG
ncbi:hypothetical protein ENSA5_14260 [Enhygromyxa salina]|uniref:DUF4410 domain-containing protein n=1 Tax=Enhygromyxa salina TaxID=215803 RepID=A0A2S9YEZ1_9BACT|nr:hypothetical protein [Enhygromyxa salina]PRQ03591.1 hypothetical protein ENSA5_14260 [Enhygromyxa salina]